VFFGFDLLTESDRIEVGDNSLNRVLFDYKELRMFLSPSPNSLSNVGGVFSGEHFRPHFNSPTWGAEHMRNGVIETKKLYPRQVVPDARGIPLATTRRRNPPLHIGFNWI
jgi:hypothetical protein